MGLLAIGPAVGGVDSGIAPELAVKTLILHPSDTQVQGMDEWVDGSVDGPKRKCASVG